MMAAWWPPAAARDLFIPRCCGRPGAQSIVAAEDFRYG
jgi:hypothetical protein